MIIDMTIQFILTPDSIARILCDSLTTHADGSFGDGFNNLLIKNREEIEEISRMHISRYGRLGVPTDKQLANSFSITESQAHALVKTVTDHLETIK